MCVWGHASRPMAKFEIWKQLSAGAKKVSDGIYSYQNTIQTQWHNARDPNN